MAFRLLQSSRLSVLQKGLRLMSTESSKSGVIVGVYESSTGSFPSLTPAAEQINSATSGNLINLLQYGGTLKAGGSRVLYGVGPDHPVVCAVGLSSKEEDSPLELRDAKKEAIRIAVAGGYKSLSDLGLSTVSVDSCGDSEAAAEGALLSSFVYDDLKSTKKPRPAIQPLEHDDISWKRGLALASGQNLARHLMETPANIMTPTQFAQEAVTSLEHLGVEVHVRSFEWAKARNMNAFLSVTRGSIEPPVFLEIFYKGGAPAGKHVALVGKGVTFDSGGISIKPSANMDKMRADMGGAACVVGALQSIAALKLPINVKGYIPLCENMPSGSATKPGDVVIASNGKSIQIDNTDAEGRLILADALVHASSGSPSAIIDMATLTGAMSVALGTGATGVFSNSDSLFETMNKAGHISGDRVWRMPLFKSYTKQVTEHGLADVHNIGKSGREAGSCTAAAFLQEFVTCDHWMHMDIAGVMEASEDVPYLGTGMSGRPTRTVVHFAALHGQQDS